MSKSFRIFLGFAVGVVLATSAAFPVFAEANIMQVSPNYPYAEQLPWGGDTIVFDVGRNDDSSWTNYRYYIPPSCTWAVVRGSPIQLVISMQTAVNNVSNEALVFYRQSFTGNPVSWGSPTRVSITPDSQGYYIYTLTFNSAVTSSNLLYRCTRPVDVDNWQFQPTLYTYPSDGRYAATQVNNNVNRAATSIVQQINNNNQTLVTELSRNHAQDMTQASQNHAADMTQRSQQHSEIMNAGENEATLDTNNDWMDDSLSKMNGWLDDLSNFEAQMEDNREENAANMSQAGQVLSDFFGNLPTAIIAAMALVLVIIVVVKIVGR